MKKVLTKLKQRREDIKWSQEDVARKANRSVRTVARAERGASLNETTADALARAVGKNVRELE